MEESARERMALSYLITFLIVPIIIAVICTVTVLLFGCCVLTPGKVVRIMFPYIRRNGNNTVVLGFILTARHIRGLFVVVCFIIAQVTLTFCTNILIIYTNNNNLFSATSIELQCYYANGTIVELTAIERLQLDEDIYCIAINFNIAGAMGQATGALAFGWVIASIASWTGLNVNYWIVQRIKNNKRKFKCYELFLLIIIILAIMASGSIIPIVLYFNAQLFLYLIKPENAIILIILIAVVYIIHNPDIRKEPKSLEEHCRETMEAQVEKLKEMPDEEVTYKRAMINIAKLEYQRLLVKEVVEKRNDEDAMKKAADIVFNKVYVVQNRDMPTEVTEEEDMSAEKDMPAEQEDTPTEPTVIQADIHTAQDNEETSL